MPSDSAETPPDTAGSNDTVAKTLVVTIVLCLACSLLVSSATVLLRPYQEANRVEDRKRNILRAAGLLVPDADIDTLFERVEPRLVDLSSGAYVEDADPTAFDARRAAKDPERSVAIPAELDPAKIRRRATQALIYLVRDGDQLEKVVLPVHGAGLYSTLYGYLALGADGSTVAGLSFYEQSETPGLGGEITNPRWLAKWPGKQVYDDQRRRRIEVVKGAVDRNSPLAVHQVDGVAGATLTSRGVDKLLAYWLDDQGYRPYLNRIAAAGKRP